MHEFYALEGSYKLQKKPPSLSWDSVARTVFKLRARYATNRDMFPGRGTSFFSLPRRQYRTWNPRQPPAHCVPGTFSPEVKWPEREAEHLPAYGG